LFVSNQKWVFNFKYFFSPGLKKKMVGPKATTTGHLQKQGPNWGPGKQKGEITETTPNPFEGKKKRKKKKRHNLRFLKKNSFNWTNFFQFFFSPTGKLKLRLDFFCANCLKFLQFSKNRGEKKTAKI